MWHVLASELCCCCHCLVWHPQVHLLGRLHSHILVQAFAIPVGALTHSLCQSASCTCTPAHTAAHSQVVKVLHLTGRVATTALIMVHSTIQLAHIAAAAAIKLIGATMPELVSIALGWPALAP